MTSLGLWFVLFLGFVTIGRIYGGGVAPDVQLGSMEAPAFPERPVLFTSPSEDWISKLAAARINQPTSSLDKVKMKKDDRNTKVEMEKRFPWLEVFDDEVRSFMTDPEVKINYGHVIATLEFLENRISSEVSKLRRKPDQATYILHEIRKRFSITKVSAWLGDLRYEAELLPTFGLLMMHFVNITLVSSKMEELSNKIVAGELYYMLKLMFEVDSEFVLDVVLCSNLDEHAATDDDVGFQVCSNIVADRSSYLGSKSSESSKMKYCYVASILSDSAEGQKIIERDLRSDASKDFVVYLNNTLGMELEVTNNYLYKNIVENIKTKRFIAGMSRSRLIIVSARVFDREHDKNADSQRRKSPLITFENSQILKNHNLYDSSEEDEPEGLRARLDTTGSYSNDDAGSSSNEDDSVGSSRAKRRRTDELRELFGKESSSKGSEGSSSTKNSSNGSNVTTSVSSGTSQSPDITKSQPVSTPSQSQPAQSIISGMKPRDDRAAPATTNLSTRRVTRAQLAKPVESSKETNAYIDRGANAPPKTRGRGGGGEAGGEEKNLV
ncbi:unnamed protein product [Orchesella dallaii]|uniref:Uncharacterized protein n=1 Tax=Orchesella dallaii TaxID=48710 RepID=A0ABP1R600_9HEXA